MKMKRKFITILTAALCAVSCELEFAPTDSGSGDDLLKNASSAISIIDGVDVDCRLVNRWKLPPVLRNIGIQHCPRMYGRRFHYAEYGKRMVLV